MKLAATHRYILIKPPALSGEKNITSMLYADSFEVLSGGAIVFYVNSNASPIPILSLASGQWLSCALLESNNSVVHSSAMSDTSLPVVHQSTTNSPKNQANSFDDNDKKAKIVLIQNELKSFVRERSFNASEFVRHLNHIINSRQMSLKVNKEDIDWLIVDLLKRSEISYTKFQNSKAMAILDVYIKGPLKRHWDNKKDTQEIYKIMQEIDEARDLSPVDLGVWLSANGYYK